MVDTMIFDTLIVYGQKVLILSKQCLYLTILDDINPGSKYLKTGQFVVYHSFLNERLNWCKKN